MPAFEYSALDSSGRTTRGVLQADTARAARALLRERGLNPLQVEAAAREARGLLSGGGSALPGAKLAMFVRQLATLVASGLPVEEALQAIADGSEPRVRTAVVALRARVMEGASLAGAMAEDPATFPPLFRASVEAGESSGRLDSVLQRLSDYAESRDALRRRLILALTYPALLVVVALLVVFGLMTWVVPQVIGVFAQQQQALPFPTRALLALTDMLGNGPVLLGLGTVLALGLILVFSRTPRVVAARDRMVLGMPVLGRLVRANETARFARTLALLVGSAVPLLESLSIATQVVANRFLRQQIQPIGARVREGQPFSRALADTGYFPAVAVRLIATGERSGQLDRMLGEAAANQERELDTSIGVAMAAIGPGVILAVGAMVLFIVLAILLPIFELNSLVR